MTRHDILIRHATVIDGTGAPRRTADIAVDGDRITAIGDLSGHVATREIDATGLIAAPGFIDVHTHDDRILFSDPSMTAKVSQGVTTVIGGNCGISLAPMPVPVKRPVTPPLDLLDASGDWYRFPTFAAYVEAFNATPAAVNCAHYVGHTTLRAITMDDLTRPATPAEIAAMQALVTEAMEAGALGVSTGLAYPPAIAATTEEVIEVTRPIAAHDGLYATHMRDESEYSIEALDESFAVGRALGVQVLISHHKLAGEENFGQSVQTLAHIDAHRADQQICLDCYPYEASSTILTVSHAKVSPRTIVTWSVGAPQMAGRELSDICAEWGCDLDTACARLIPAGAVYFRMCEEDVQRILAYPPTMIGSDGLPHDERPHPRLWGTFPRVLGRYARDLGLFDLETAVHKMTGLTAGEIGLAERGELRAGFMADITLFDDRTIADRATYTDPIQPAAGIALVMVNGAPVWQDGRPTGARPGRYLRRDRAAQKMAAARPAG